jgi:hypothetical protein
MRRLRRYVAPTSGAHPRHHVLDNIGGRSDFIALFLRYIEPESGYYRVEFLSGHIRPPIVCQNLMRPILSAFTTAPEDLVKSGQRESEAGTRQDCQADTRIFNE